MARTMDTIIASLIAKKEAEENLVGLTSTSKVSIWRLQLYVVAFAVWSLEILFDGHKAEVSDIILQLKPHTATWYRNKALAFQYGFDLYPDTDVFVNEGKTPEQIEASKIIKYAAVTEATNESRLILKVATENGDGVLSPISIPQTESFEPYIDEIRDAGLKVTVINYLPDILKLKIAIYYDPLVLSSEGIAITGSNSGKKPVEIALQEFMRELPFNGELVLSALVDKLQKTEGVSIPNLVSAASKWINDGGTGYGNFENITVKQIPVAGYFQIEDFTGITYIAN